MIKTGREMAIRRRKKGVGKGIHERGGKGDKGTNVHV
jgi:hypothetical protein